MDVDAAVLDVKGTGESVPAAMVVVRFRNLSSDHLEVQDYRLDWPGGRFTAAPRDLRVAPHAEVDRTARVEPRHGDLAALLARPDQAKAQVLRARVVPA
jgi:hypothetical protein